MPSAIQTLSMEALRVVRSLPLAHKVVHAAARLLEKTPVGARYIRSVLEPRFVMSI